MKIIDQSQSNTAAALEIQQCIDEVSGFVSAKLQQIYNLVNTPGRQQAILDRIGMNGVPPAQSLQAYVAFHQAMELLAPGIVPPADPAVFVAQPDGAVLYVEPEEEPSDNP